MSKKDDRLHLVPRFDAGDTVYTVRVYEQDSDEMRVRIEGPVEICLVKAEGSSTRDEINESIEYTINALDATFSEDELCASLAEAVKVAQKEMNRIRRHRQKDAA